MSPVALPLFRSLCTCRFRLLAVFAAVVPTSDCRVLSKLAVRSNSVGFLGVAPSPDASSPTISGAVAAKNAPDDNARQRLPLLPYPASVNFAANGAKPFVLSGDISIAVGKGIPADDLGIQIIHGILRKVGSKIVGGGGKTIAIDLNPSVGDNAESYHMRVSHEKVELSAPALPGLFYAVQTLAQLVPSNGSKIELPAVTIRDAPRFQWRGLQLDVSRHFFGAEEVKKLIDTMAAFKLNRFHWHLTDDQGWRLPIPGYRLLTVAGAVDKEGAVQAYKTEEIEDVIAYARARHVEVLPEVDIPGHVEAAIAAYPRLGNTDIRFWYPPRGPSRKHGVHDFTLSPKNTTLAFVAAVLAEVKRLFPGHLVHIGGDEAPTRQWNQSNIAKALLQVEGVRSVQAVFNKRLGQILHKLNRTMVGWDEVQHLDGLPSDAIVMAWRSADELSLALRAGRRVVNANVNYLYFDRAQSNSSDEPTAILCCTSLRKVYEYDPMPGGLSQEQQKLVLGAEAQLWSEFFPSWSHVEYMAHPRSLALAERLWTPNESVQGFGEFRRRLDARLGDLVARGVNYRHLGHDE